MIRKRKWDVMQDYFSHREKRIRELDSRIDQVLMAASEFLQQKLPHRSSVFVENSFLKPL